MYQDRIILNAAVGTTIVGETPLRTFLWENSDALGHAAVLLAGPRGARLINALRDGMDQPGPLTRRMRRLLLDLRDVLFLEHVHDEEREEAACFALLDPEDPVVSEICLLADGLQDALRNAQLIGAKGDQAA